MRRRAHSCVHEAREYPPLPSLHSSPTTHPATPLHRRHLLLRSQGITEGAYMLQPLTVAALEGTRPVWSPREDPTRDSTENWKGTCPDFLTVPHCNTQSHTRVQPPFQVNGSTRQALDGTRHPCWCTRIVEDLVFSQRCSWSPTSASATGVSPLPGYQRGSETKS